MAHSDVAVYGRNICTHDLPCHILLPVIFSRWIPFALGDLFIFLSIIGVIAYPFYARLHKKLRWKKILLNDGEYLLWIYVWFYLAWGLNYSQKNFYQRTEIPYTEYNKENFQTFVNEYIDLLNHSYTPVTSINEKLVREESIRLYHQLSDSLGVHRPPHNYLKAKTMLFTPFISMVGVTGSMGPFFCEFTLNGDLLPVNYPATYAHELAHLLGITSEAEANFMPIRYVPVPKRWVFVFRLFLCARSCIGKCIQVIAGRRIHSTA